jgi:hypothetical protein
LRRDELQPGRIERGDGVGEDSISARDVAAPENGAGELVEGTRRHGFEAGVILNRSLPRALQ